MRVFKILVAEDDYLVTGEILRILKLRDFEIVGTASNGKEAIEKCCSLKPDIVLMDLKMPIMNGLQATKIIQENCPTPVVILTAHETEELVKQASEVGVSAFLVKPPKIEEIIKTMIVAFARHQDYMKLRNLNMQLQEEINRRVQSEEVLKMMIENNADGIGITQKGKLVFVNNSYSKILGYSKKELLKLNRQEILTGESLSFITKAINEMKNGNEYSTHLEVVMLKNDHTKIDIDVNMKKIYYKNQDAVLCQIRDITQQKEIMKVLQRGAEQTKGLNEFIPICASCHLIRDDEKEGKPWVKPADYITERLPDVKFSHGMCPDCMKKWYPDFDFNEEEE